MLPLEKFDGVRQRRHLPGGLVPAHLDVVGDVAEDDVSAHAIPGRPFGPEAPGPLPHQRRVADHVLPEALVEDLPDAGGIADRLGPIGNRCDCADAREASIDSAAAPAARNPRGSTRDVFHQPELSHERLVRFAAESDDVAKPPSYHDTAAEAEPQSAVLRIGRGRVYWRQREGRIQSAERAVPTPPFNGKTRTSFTRHRS